MSLRARIHYGKGKPMSRISRCLTVPVVTAVACVWLSGCAASIGAKGRPLVWQYPHAASETFSQTPEEHYEFISQISAHDARSLVEDLDLVFMTERSSRLSRWHDN